MEKWQKDTIDQNMKLLCEKTTFSPPFLDSLQTNKLILSIESEEFKRQQKYEEYGNYKCNHYLYNVLKESSGAYDILINLFKKYLQTDLAGILEKERSAKLEDSPVLAEGPESACEVPGTSGSTILKRPYNFSIAGSSRSQKSRKLLFNLQDPSPLFVGRTQELVKLHKQLTESSRLAVVTHITSITGLGGIGKTQLARKYAQDYKGHYDNNVLWINSESEEALTSSFTKLATDMLGISTKNANDQEKDISIIVHDCYECKNFRNRKCLFVFDNAEKHRYLQKFLPRKDSSENIYVLMTSRHQDWGKLVTKLEINVLSEEEAIAFVKFGLELEGGTFEDSIRLLVCRLQYFPLAISQAISYISNQQNMGDYSISKYLDEFEVNSGHYLDYDKSDELESDYTKTTFTTWKLTIDKIAQIPNYGHLVVKILHLVAYFSPDDIHRDTFCKLDECAGEEVKNAVSLLISYSMVSAQDKQSIISIHRLVQEVIRIELRRTGKEKEIIEMGLQLAEECLCEKFTPHAISLWKYAEGMPELVCQFVNLATRIIDTLRVVGRYNEACQFGVNSLEILKSSHPVNKQSVLEFELCLGEVFRFAGNYETSLYHLERVQEDCKRLSNIDNFLLGVQEQIAWVFDSQGRYSVALELGVKMCESSKLNFGDGHLRTTISLFMTAEIARKMGKYDLAYSTYHDGFKCYEKAVEKDEISFLTARHNFANLVVDRGNINEAISILKDINIKIVETTGLNVPFSLRTSTLSSLANFLSETNRCLEAHKIFKELYEEEKRVLGEDHEDTMKTLNNLGVSLLSLKRYEEAYSACNTAYLKLNEKLGEESEWTLEAQRSCAHVLCHQGEHDTAISLITTVVKTLERTMDLKSTAVLNSKDSYARILVGAKKSEEAIAVLEELKETYLQIFGAEHRSYLNYVRVIEKLKLGGSELGDCLS